MHDDSREIFYNLLRDHFAPELRVLGFKGSGSHFRRIRGDIINAINIQGNKYGGSCAVNLGLHLRFLPLNWKNEIPDPSTIKEIDCEFRTRLAPKGKSDYWWKYNGLFTSPDKQVRHLVKTYLRIGEPLFSRYDTAEKIADMIKPGDVGSRESVETFGYVTVIRVALTLARVHQHAGNRDLAKQFAHAGVQNIGRATSLEPLFRQILDDI